MKGDQQSFKLKTISQETDLDDSGADSIQRAPRAKGCGGHGGCGGYGGHGGWHKSLQRTSKLKDRFETSLKSHLNLSWWLRRGPNLNYDRNQPSHSKTLNWWGRRKRHLHSQTKECGSRPREQRLPPSQLNSSDRSLQERRPQHR